MPEPSRALTMNAVAHPFHPSAATGALTIQGLSKQYPLKGKPVSVLENIDLDIRPGEFVSILGASGCGKSTLLRLRSGVSSALIKTIKARFCWTGDPCAGRAWSAASCSRTIACFPG